MPSMLVDAQATKLLMTPSCQVWKRWTRERKERIFLRQVRSPTGKRLREFSHELCISCVFQCIVRVCPLVAPCMQPTRENSSSGTDTRPPLEKNIALRYVNERRAAFSVLETQFPLVINTPPVFLLRVCWFDWNWYSVALNSLVNSFCLTCWFIRK